MRPIHNCRSVCVSVCACVHACVRACIQTRASANVFFKKAYIKTQYLFRKKTALLEMDQTWSNTPCKQVSLTCFVSQNKQRQKTHTHTKKTTNKQKTWPVVLGDNGLGALTDGVHGQLTREKEARGLKKHEICIECDQYTGRKKIIKSEGKKNNKHRKETRAKNAFCSHTGGKNTRKQ